MELENWCFPQTVAQTARRPRTPDGNQRHLRAYPMKSHLVNLAGRGKHKAPPRLVQNQQETRKLRLSNAALLWVQKIRLEIELGIEGQARV